MKTFTSIPGVMRIGSSLLPQIEATSVSGWSEPSRGWNTRAYTVVCKVSAISIDTYFSFGVVGKTTQPKLAEA